LIVIEVLSEDNARKDLKRNVTLYALIASIKEYWILDPRENSNRPKLIVYRRRGRGWQKPIEIAYRGTYTTKLLPGFSLVVDPHAKQD
jgi:Uma2 family endonuclease